MHPAEQILCATTKYTKFHRISDTSCGFNLLGKLHRGSRERLAHFHRQEHWYSDDAGD